MGDQPQTHSEHHDFVLADAPSRGPAAQSVHESVTKTPGGGGGGGVMSNVPAGPGGLFHNVPSARSDKPVWDTNRRKPPKGGAVSDAAIVPGDQVSHT